MGPLLGAGLIQGGTSLISNLFNLGQAKKQREHQMKLSEYSYQKDLEMWNKANEYNSPQAQMERLKKAGLNPYLVYGSGTVSGNTTTQTPKYQAMNPEYAQVQMEAPNLLNMMSVYQDLTNKKAQYDLTQAQVRSANADIVRKGIENSWLGRNLLTGYTKKQLETGKMAQEMGISTSEDMYWSGDGDKAVLKYKQNENAPFMQLFRANLARTNQQFKEAQKRTEILELDRALKDKGFSWQDNVLIRMMVQSGLWDETVGGGIDMLIDWIKKSKN